MNILNDILASKEWLKVIRKIEKADSYSEFFPCKIEVATDKGMLSFDILISENFPLGEIRFYCSSHYGIGHQINNGQICLNTAPAKKIEDRFELELEKLQLWIDKYFIEEAKDPHFEYYQFTQQKNIQVLFEEEESKPIPKDTCGTFKYGKLNEFHLETKSVETWIAHDTGGRKCNWNDYYKKLSKMHTGVWILLSGPPVIKGRLTIEKWEDLLKLMTLRQAQYLYDEHKKLKAFSGYDDGFLVLAGYRIDSGVKQEIHWDTIFIPYTNFPYDPKKIEQGNYIPLDKGYTVDWCRSTNVSYERLFGRGKLCNEITERNILVIGTGAIGSSLFTSLVRGGCKKVHISDFDDIDPGNVCRGEFTFKESWKPKIAELYHSAIAISPYITVDVSPGIVPMRKHSKNYKEQKNRLMKFDYIFDCSTDKYLSIMLDEMDLRGEVINFSISDKANHFASITGKGNIHIIKNDFYNKISAGSAEVFFVATGCWHPTFQASFVDINTPLMFALNEINQRLEKRDPLHSFYIEKKIDDKKVLSYQIKYNV